MIYIFAYHNKGSTTAEELYEIRFYVTLYLLYRWYKDVSEYLYGFGEIGGGLCGKRMQEQQGMNMWTNFFSSLELKI